MKGPQAEEVEEWRRRHIKRKEQRDLDRGQNEMWLRMPIGVLGSRNEDGVEWGRLESAGEDTGPSKLRRKTWGFITLSAKNKGLLG